MKCKLYPKKYILSSARVFLWFQYNCIKPQFALYVFFFYASKNPATSVQDHIYILVIVLNPIYRASVYKITFNCFMIIK